MQTHAEPKAPAARTDAKAPTFREGNGAVRALRLALESTGHSRLARDFLLVVAVFLPSGWFDFWPRWPRFSLTLGMLGLGRMLITRLLSTRLILDTQFLRVEQPSRSTTLIIPWASIAFVEVRDGDRLLICRHSGEATIVGPFVRSYFRSPRGKLELAANLAEAALERHAAGSLTT